MVELGYLLRGVWIGLLIAVPVGPIGLLCIHRTIANGRLVGFASGLGAATADMLYGFVAAFGLTLLTGFLMSHLDWVRMGGAVFLAYLGARAFFTRPAAGDIAPTSRGLLSAWASTFALTLANPMTIVLFVGVFAGLGLDEHAMQTADAASLVLGVFAGSALWWLTLSGAVGFLHGRFEAGILRWLNRLAGVVLLGVAVALVLRRV